MRDFLVFGLIIAVIIILARVIMGTPMIKRVRESFVSGGSMINTMTECPPGAAMYMFEGVAYCCSGQINADADRIGDTCRPLWTRENAPLTFCTLGPEREKVKNCLETRAGMLQAEGETMCPKEMPNFVRGGYGANTAAGRCCASPGNSAMTDCQDLSQPYCNATTDANLFETAGGAPNTCQFMRAQEDDGPCPKGFGAFTAAGQGAMAALTLYGCTDNGTNCYAASTLKRLQELGYDVSGLTACSASATGS
jgi:hypothetical protein